MRGRPVMHIAYDEKSLSEFIVALWSSQMQRRSKSEEARIGANLQSHHSLAPRTATSRTHKYSSTTVSIHRRDPSVLPHRSARGSMSSNLSIPHSAQRVHDCNRIADVVWTASHDEVLAKCLFPPLFGEQVHSQKLTASYGSVTLLEFGYKTGNAAE